MNRLKLILRFLQITMITSILYKPLRMLLLNITFIIIIRVIFMKEIYAESAIEKVASLMLSEPAHENTIQDKEGGNINYGFLDYLASFLLDPSYREEEYATASEADHTEQEYLDEQEPDSSSKSESDQNDQEYESFVESLYQPRKGFNYPILDQLDLLLSSARNKEDYFTESVAFAQDKVPPECWAKSVAEFKSPESKMFHYLDEMRLNLGSVAELSSYIHYRAAAKAYDICQVTNQPHNIIKMREQYENNLQSMNSRLQNN